MVIYLTQINMVRFVTWIMFLFLIGRVHCNCCFFYLIETKQLMNHLAKCSLRITAIVSTLTHSAFVSK